MHIYRRVGWKRDERTDECTVTKNGDIHTKVVFKGKIVVDNTQLKGRTNLYVLKMLYTSSCILEMLYKSRYILEIVDKFGCILDTVDKFTCNLEKVDKFSCILDSSVERVDK